MVRDNTGQVALEYLLIFAVSLIILIAFTLPLLEQSMDFTFDVSDTIKVKSDLSKLSQSIMQVYGEGQGSKQSVSLDVKTPVKITVSDSKVSAAIKLKNGEYKTVDVNVKSKLKSDSFNLKKGRHTFVVEWPVNSKIMLISLK